MKKPRRPGHIQILAAWLILINIMQWSFLCLLLIVLTAKHGSKLDYSMGEHQFHRLRLIIAMIIISFFSLFQRLLAEAVAPRVCRPLGTRERQGRLQWRSKDWMAALYAAAILQLTSWSVTVVILVDPRGKHINTTALLAILIYTVSLIGYLVALFGLYVADYQPEVPTTQA